MWGTRREGGGYIAWYEQKRIWCVVEASCITSSPSLWVWSQQHILFCHYLSALGIHQPNVANWLLKGVTYSGLVFGIRIHGGLCKQAILICEWSCLRETTQWVFSAVHCYAFTLFGWVFAITDHPGKKRYLIAQNQFLWLGLKRLGEMKQYWAYYEPSTQISSLH